jgi:hypothetical protein
MATEKQIAANRANAKRSTGPKTLLGKMTSSRNAFRHGLSCRFPQDPVRVDTLAKALLGSVANDQRLPAAAELAEAQLDLLSIRSARAKIMATIDFQSAELEGLTRLLALDRYERYAHTRRRRASQKLV